MPRGEAKPRVCSPDEWVLVVKESHESRIQNGKA